MRISLLALALAFALVACSKSSSTPPADSPEPGAGEGTTDQRPELTAAACEAQGGTVVGDIGDGAIHRPDYRCPDSGEAPLGSIAADPAGPVAVEGSVCCK